MEAEGNKAARKEDDGLLSPADFSGQGFQLIDCYTGWVRFIINEAFVSIFPFQLQFVSRYTSTR